MPHQECSMNRRSWVCRAVLLISNFAALVSCAISPGDSAAVEIDPSLLSWTDGWNTLLAAIVDRFGAVDYRAALSRMDTLQPLVDQLAPPRHFTSESDRTAFLINAYNLLVIRGLSAAPNIESPRQLPGFYDKHHWKILGEDLTLDELRDQKLRPRNDPRIHAAICYGAVGSVPLSAEAYRGDRLNDQLDRQCGRWINHPTHVAAVGSLVLASPIFQWFEPDFAVEPFDSVLGFLRRYARGDSPLGRLLAEKSPPPIDYLEFNWAINARVPSEAER